MVAEERSLGSPSRPRMAGRESSSARREAILVAALECFSELGWTATTIADIRRRSGASIGSIYHHFKDKEGVAAALYVESLHRYREALRVRLDRSRTAKGLVRTIVLHHIEWSVEHRAHALYLLEMRGTEAVKRAEADLRASTKVFLEEIFVRLKGHIEAGEIMDLPHSLYAPLLIGPAQDVVRHWLRGRVHRDIQPLAKPLADAAWRSLERRSSS